MPQPSADQSAIRVVFVEDDAGTRQGLEALLASSAGFDVAGSYPSVEAALHGFAGEADVLLMDIHLPGLSGIEGVRLLHARFPLLPIVMLTVYDDVEQIFNALKAGASGYLLKRAPSADLLGSIADVVRGGAPMSSSIARKVVQSFHATPEQPDPAAALTPRERDVLNLLAGGYRYREIADALFISLDTVRAHVRSIYDKLHVRSRTEAVLRFLGER